VWINKGEIMPEGFERDGQATRLGEVDSRRRRRGALPGELEQLGPSRPGRREGGAGRGRRPRGAGGPGGPGGGGGGAPGGRRRPPRQSGSQPSAQSEAPPKPEQQSAPEPPQTESAPPPQPPPTESAPPPQPPQGGDE
jgi:hypothetical protein